MHHVSSIGSSSTQLRIYRTYKNNSPPEKLNTTHNEGKMQLWHTVNLQPMFTNLAYLGIRGHSKSESRLGEGVRAA